MSKYELMLRKNQADQDGDGRVWDRYGFSESEWAALSTEEREIHHDRHRVCDHPYKYQGIETEPGVFYQGDDWSLRGQYSHDPYFHTAHMIPCRRKDDPKCDCQMCLQKIGIWRGND